MELIHIVYAGRNECFACWDGAVYAVVLFESQNVGLYCEKHSDTALRMNLNFFDVEWPLYI